LEIGKFKKKTKEGLIRLLTKLDNVIEIMKNYIIILPTICQRI
jgi:hypothetical protein